MKKSILLSVILFVGCGTEPTDCAGIVNGIASEDDCGMCTGGTTGLIANSSKDCAGVCGGTAVEDCAGVCDGNTTQETCDACQTLVFDCAGVCNGSAIVDCAGVCGGSSEVDCAGVCGGSAVLSGCDNACNSTAVVDCAGVCGGSNTNCSNELDGTWVGYEDGNTSGTWTYDISGSEMDIVGPDEWYGGTFSINTQTNPKQMDIIITDCVSPDYIGTTALGIYKIEGNILTFAGNEPGSTIRPANFTEGRVFILTKQ